MVLARSLRVALLVAACAHLAPARSAAAEAAPPAQGSPAPADPQIERALRALREDASIKVRARAAFALAQRDAREAVPALRRALAEDESPVVRVAAAAALERLGGSDSIGALRDASARDPSLEVRAAANRAIEKTFHAARLVSLGQVEGSKVDALLRARLRAVLAAQLQRHGFAVVDDTLDVGYHLRPSVLVLDRIRSGGGIRIEMQASVMAIDRRGRVSAIVQGGAQVKSTTPGVPQDQLDGQAFDAAARSISEDLARRLLDGA
jgi:hypothetical protein